MNNDKSNEVMQFGAVISKTEFDSAYQEVMRVWATPITVLQTGDDKKTFDRNLDIVTRYQGQQCINHLTKIAPQTQLKKS